MKIEICYKSKNYVVEYKEIIEVKDIIAEIKKKNKIKKSKKLLLCNEDRYFEEEEKIGEIHDQELFFIIELVDVKKPKFKKPKKEDLAELVKKCTGAKEKLETRYLRGKNFGFGRRNLDFSIFERSENSERNSLRAEMIRSAFAGRGSSFNNPSSTYTTVPSRENIDRLLEMGFTEENAKAALTRTRNDLSSAVDLIMNDQLINPEARNEDFRMNRNNSNILANISTRNLQGTSDLNTDNANANVSNNNVTNIKPIINNSNNNNPDDLNYQNQINHNILNNTNNNTRSIIINRPNETDNENNSSNTNNNANNNNNRSVRFNLDLDNNDSESSGFRDIIEPFEIDLPLSTRFNISRSRSRLPRESARIGRFFENSRLQPRDRELYPRFDRDELSRIMNPMDFISQVIRRDDNTNNNADTNGNNSTNNANRTDSTISNNISRNANDPLNNNLRESASGPTNNSTNTNLIINDNNVLNLDLNLNTHARNPSIHELIPEEIDSVYDFNYVSAIDDLNREAISLSNQRNNAIDNTNINNINTNNDLNRESNNNLNINSSDAPVITDLKLDEITSSENSPKFEFNSTNKKRTNLFNLNMNSNNVSNQVKKSSNNIFKITADKNVANSSKKKENETNNINLNTNNTNTTNNISNNRNIFTITNTNTQNNFSINNLSRINNTANNIQNSANNANTQNDNMKKSTNDSIIPNNLNTNTNTNTNNTTNTNIYSVSSENTNLPSINSNIRNINATLPRTTLNINNTSNSNSNNQTSGNLPSNLPNDSVTRYTNLLNNTISNNTSTLNSNSLIESNRNAIRRIPSPYDPLERNSNLNGNRRASRLTRFFRTNDTEILNDDNNNTERTSRNATNNTNNRSEGTANIINVNESISNSNDQSRSSPNLVDIYENPQSSNLNNSNRNPLSRFGNREADADILRNLDSSRTNFLSSRVNERLGLSTDRRNFANLIFGGLRSEDESSSDEEMIFTSSVYNNYNNLLNRRRTGSGIFARMESNMRNLIRNRHDSLNENALNNTNIPVERADNILDNLRIFNNSNYNNFENINSDNNSNNSENSILDWIN